MSIEAELQTLILSRYRSIRDFSLKIGLPQSTVDSILHRGILNAGIGKVLKICNTLGISADKLAEGKITPNEKLVIDITLEEQQHLTKYRSLDDADRDLVDNIIDNLHDRRLNKLSDRSDETMSG